MGKRGRPWAPLPDGIGPEATELVTMLRALVDAKGCGLEGLGHLLRTTGGEDERPTPSYGTLSSRLRGVGLLRDGVLISRIIIACGQTHEHSSQQQRANELLAEARRRPPTQPSGKARPAPTNRATSELRELRAEVSRLGGLIEELVRASAPVTEVSAAPVLVEPEPLRTGASMPDRTDLLTHLNQLVVIDGLDRTALSDPAVRRVADAVHSVDPTGSLLGLTLRQAIDEVLDGPHTGRYSWAQLTKLEKSYFGAKAETLLGRALGLAKGESHDFSVEGLDVETKVSVSGRWLFERTAIGAIHLLVHVDDENSRWQLGVVRITEDLLSRGMNRDQKRSLSAAGREAITWLFRDTPLPENILLHVPQDRLEAILSRPSAQSRTDELFRRVTLRPISSASVATVAMQPDGGKRARDARRTLIKEGVAVIGHGDLFIAEQLGLTVPRRGEWMSVPLKLAVHDVGDGRTVRLVGQDWVVAGPDEVLEPLPPNWSNTT